MTRFNRFLLPLAAGLALPAPALAQEAPRFANVYSDHMVLQRGAPIRFDGTAAPGETVTVQFGSERAEAIAGEDGRWQVAFAPREAGGPYRIEAATADGAEALDDVLIGDVWLCSGQSNMEYPVYRALNPDSEISAAHHDDIRILTIPHDSRPAPLDDLAEPAGWQPVTPETIRDFSAVCYFFGRDLKTRHDVPMGLIDASWGGSQIEAWIGADGLRSAGGYGEELDMLAAYAGDPGAAMSRFGTIWQDWWRSTRPNTPWTETEGDWTPVPSLSDWRGWEDPQVRDHLGMLWYRTTVELSADQAAAAASLALGGIDEVDTVWINGRFLGNTFGWGVPRRYDIPAGMLQPGENTITVNVLNSWGAGGMTGPADAMAIEFDGADDAAIGEDWHYRVVPAEAGSPPRAPWESVGGLTGMHNGMTAPLERFALAGALWYQGESNAGRPETYRALLDALIADWRRGFGADLPVFVVQLPNFGALQSGPVESGWAQIREAQRDAAAADPRVGLAVAIDLGDRFDIHPPNKQAVAARLVRSAESLLHDGPLSASGAEPAGAVRDRNGVTVSFSGTGGSLTVIGDDRPTAFELCGDEPGSCRFAEARLEGENVILVGPGAGTAARVRFCWADAPICNLYDATGLPVGPFEMDVEGR